MPVDKVGKFVHRIERFSEGRCGKRQAAKYDKHDSKKVMKN